MSTIPETIAALEKEIRETPYHKGTEHHIGRLRAKIANLKDRELEKGTKKGGGGGGYAIKKQGDATVVLVGPPSAGKSTLINRLTNANSKVAPYAFTTVSIIPGMLKYKNAYIQILDVPGLIEGAEAGKGRGREVLSVVRGADLLIIISDVGRPEAIERIKSSLEENGIRIGKPHPQVNIKKMLAGGVLLHSNITQNLEAETIKEIAREMGLKNAEITLNEKLTIENLVDAFSKNRVYIPAITILNKTDLKASNSRSDLSLSAEKGTGIEKLKNLIWEKLNLTRIFLVRRDEEPSHKNPIIVKKNYKLKDVAEKIGEEFAKEHKRAMLWGPGSKFPGQEVSLKTPVQEDMQVRFL